MKLVISTKTLMILYTNGFNDPYSHIVKITLAEKCLNFEEQLVKKNMEVLKNLNPYCYTPILIDRALILYKTEI
ncbi:MAG: stringent starvation protein A, partial [Deltaproteobacteria bacterium]